MKMRASKILMSLPAAIALASAPQAGAEETASGTTGVIEEVVVVGRLKSSATDVVVERLDQEVVVDLLSAEDISRVGDSTVAAALRRVPGLTLVDNQFVYVRGLGERYSSTLLDGATVPSPDFMRNVIPLDIFPTNILDSLAVQKGYSADMPAAFGGGNIDIRTRNIPDGPIFDIEVGSGWNFESGSNTFTSSGGDDDWFGADDGGRALPAEISGAIQQYRGDVSTPNILNTLRFDGPATLTEATAINRQLATSLDATTGIREADVDADISLETTLGNRFYLGDQEQWEVGGMAILAYDNTFRNRERVNRGLIDPDERFFRTSRTVHQVSVTGALKAGVSWNGEQNVDVSYLFLRNTEEDTNVGSGFNANFLQSDGQRLGAYGTRYEQRDLGVFMLDGSHELGSATLDFLDFIPADLSALEGLRFEWYYSDSTAETEVPNETSFLTQSIVDPVSGAIQSTRLRNTNSAGIFRFTELEDEVQSYGTDVILPIFLDDWDLEFAGGWDYARKGREFLLTQVFLDASQTPLAALEADISGIADNAVTRPAIANPANAFEISVNSGLPDSYLAGQITEGVYGKFDATWQGTWRFSAGVRYEEFRQASLAIDNLQFDPVIGQAIIPPTGLQDSTLLTDDYYPSAALTWIQQNFMGADDFQLRFGFSQTVARPDLREISAAVYIDPLTESRIVGTPGLDPSDISNYDARAEWFWGNGDSFTVSLFYKDIENPIETVQAAGTDDNQVLTFINADTGEVYGIEFEFLKGLGFMADYVGGWADGLFVSGNLTLSDSEIQIGENALSLTNDSRRLTQHSEWVLNTHLGYDSPDGLHSASVVYNVYGERIFSAGRFGAEDSFEQPIHLVDLVYSFYPTDRVTFQLKVQNLLDDEREIEQDSVDFGAVTIFEQLIGTTASASLKWSF
ncbi:MAG: TonB-dependent receptor [Pseudomonadales bacterium]|jgi:TonB-dependent receptor|nr:TonB-dependent receptor [Pseudomonadales bacterium]